MGCAFGLHCKVLAASSRLWVAWTFYEMEFYVCFAIEMCLFSSCTCTGFVIKTQIWSLCFFRCRIRWEFESPVIPLLSKIAPSDVILVRSLPADSAILKPGMRKECSIPQRRNHSSHAGYVSKGSRGVACVWTQPWPPGKEAWRNWKYLVIGDRYEPFEDQG